VPSDLTIGEIADLKPGVHRVAPLLYIVNKPPRRSWIMIYTSPLTGRRTEMGLGPCEVLTTARAKALVLRHRVAILEGRCPLAEKRSHRAARDPAAKTFRDAAQAWEASKRPTWREGRHTGQWLASMALHVFPAIGALPVRVIDTQHVLSVLEPMWNKTPETAARIRSRIERVLGYATSQGWRSGENPARWQDHMANLLARPTKSRRQRVQHLAAVPWPELPALWSELEARDTLPALAVRLMVLTAARRSEVIDARWSEFDLTGKVWTIPGERMKAGNAHSVPLSDPALALLGVLAERRMGAFVFPGARRGGPLAGSQALLVLKQLRPGVTLHGLRNGFTDWARNHGVALDVRERALAHVVPGDTRPAYERDDLLEPRRDVMQRWAAFLTTSM
jgi:integrase